MKWQGIHIVGIPDEIISLIRCVVKRVSVRVHELVSFCLTLRQFPACFQTSSSTLKKTFICLFVCLYVDVSVRKNVKEKKT